MDPKKKLQQALQRQQTLVDTAKAANRDLTDAENAEFEALQREIDQLKQTIAEQERSHTTPAPAPHAEPSATTQTSQDDIQRAIEAERSRVAEITDLCRSFDIDPQQYINAGNSMDEVRAAVLDHMKKNGAPIGTGVSVDNVGDDEFCRDMADGLLMRGGVHLENPSNGAQQMSNMSLRDMAIECLERDGVTNARRMGHDELFVAVSERAYYNPTAAFPTMLDNAINKAYVEGHKTAAVTFDRRTKKGSLKDFKLHDNNYLAGPIGDFLEVPEGGELKNDIPTDAKLPTRRIKTYGKQFTLTRQAFINDDIDLVTRIPARYAAAARRTINTQCYRILMENPAIYDGVALFDKTNHANALATGTGVTAQAMQAMIMALSTQKDQFDQPIIVRPATLVVPAGYAFEMYTLFNSPTINTTDNTQAVNPMFNYRSSIEIVEDPTINSLAGGFGKVMPWFLMGAKEDTDFIEVDYLNGQEIPTIRRMETPGQLGFVWDIYLDWGINVMDYRGAIKNPGVKVESPLK